jgi:thymidine kinase
MSDNSSDFSHSSLYRSKSSNSGPFFYSRCIVITGPVTAGKTSDLERRANEYMYYDGISPLYINHRDNGRWGSSDSIKGRNNDKKGIPAIAVAELMDTLDSEIAKSNPIFIDEAQFFPDLYEFVMKWYVVNGKTIIMYGLNGDFKQEQFESISKVIPLASEIKVLHAICSHSGCNRRAFYSVRITDETEQFLVGDDIYKAVCVECLDLFNRHSKTLSWKTKK